MIGLAYSAASVLALVAIKFWHFSPALTIATACFFILAAFVCAYMDFRRNKGFNSYMKNVSAAYLIFALLFMYASTNQ
ncbi:hypothetical protein [Paenibacillus lutrae]|uniref:Uncharacterized protein n=1 Tax=Paenibacillus lutrae TaxID=2078573 RepID=A0A7X3FHZ2_9BACL|nr:hypothetical protein [Paenibacillus lutrae]MVO99838.1 hypothetical protein [Paenibacillus lutrae]